MKKSKFIVSIILVLFTIPTLPAHSLDLNLNLKLGQLVSEIYDAFTGAVGTTLANHDGWWSSVSSTWTLDGSGNAICTPSSYGTAVINDDAADDGTADYALLDCTLTFDTDHYVATYVANTQHISKTVALTVGVLYEFGVDVKNGATSDVGGSINLGDGYNGVSGSTVFFYTTAAWVTHKGLMFAKSTTDFWSLYSAMTGAGNYQVKNLYLKPITISEVLAPVSVGYKDFHVTINLGAIKVGASLGVVLSYSDANNFVLMLLERLSGGGESDTTQLKASIYKNVNGTVSAVGSQAVYTYEENAELIVIKTGSTYELWHNNQFLRSEIITDHVNNTQVGMFSDHPTNTIKDITIKPFSATSSVKVVMTDTTIDVFTQSPNSKTDRWIQWGIERETVAYAAGGVPANHNLDCWRLKYLYETDSSFSKQWSETSLVTAGAWELAIKENASDDFVGTYHGGEVLSSFTVTADGVVKSGSASFWASELVLVQNSTVYRRDTESTDIATVVRTWTFDKDGLTLNQVVTWTVSALLDSAYLGMCPIKRVIGSNQVTDRYNRDADPKTVHDVSSATFGAPGTTAVINVGKASVWGSASGITVTMAAVTASALANETQFISDAEVYNKLYFDWCGSYTPALSEVWTSEYHYEITTGN